MQFNYFYAFTFCGEIHNSLDTDPVAIQQGNAAAVLGTTAANWFHQT